MNNGFTNFLKETLSIVVIAFILAMFLRAFVIEGRIIPSGSMLPTIQLQDRVMVNKFIYRFKEPQHGDIVVFDPPEELHSRWDYIKRVVGLPGDKVEIKEGKVYIDDQPLKEPYLNEPIGYEYGPVTVPPDSLLVLGDNRNESFDSHRWNVWLTRDRLKGKAIFVYWPPKHLGLLERQVGIELTEGL